MAEYFAMIKLLGDNTPYKLNYTAGESYHDALQGMLKGANRTDTNQLSEFEIMRVTEKGDAYTPVASKGPKRKRPSTDPPKVTPPAAPVSTTEQLYSPTKVVEEGTV